ncbi:cytotoxic necrotizing factor Rho-activating domain-containing protein [Paraburkholderia sp. IW21]|uniref:cytotoxic necrotizing factor Rho-activating domain-containing protein n=1 Tax=Paraburkholderia sp. IW21 TaxID=3242488 RepID=UPI003521F15F
MPQGAHDVWLADSEWHQMPEFLRPREKVKWSTPLVEYHHIPRACHTEFQRVLFSAGSQLSGWLAYSGLLSFGYWALAKVSPMASVVAAAGTTVYNLVAALRQRDVLGGLVQVLLALPYQLLSPQSLLFAIAEETKRYIDEVLDGVTPECLTSQRENIYMGVGLVALFSYYGYFVKRQAVNPLVSNLLGRTVYPSNGFLLGNDMQPPGTPLGQTMAGMIGKLQRAVQGYAVLQTIVNAASGTREHDIHTGQEGLQAERMVLSPEEKAIQKREKRARFDEARSARIRSNTTRPVIGELGLETPASLTTAAGAMGRQGEADGFLVGHPSEDGAYSRLINTTSNATPITTGTGVTAHVIPGTNASATAVAEHPIWSGRAETAASTTVSPQSIQAEQTNATIEAPQLDVVGNAAPEASARSPGAKSGGYVSVPMAAATATAATVVGHAAFSTAGGEAVALTVENTALLVDGEAGALAATAGVQSLVRKSPLVGGVVGGVGALGAGAYGLYRLVTWLQQADGDEPAPQVLAHGENLTSAVSEGVDATAVSENGSTVMHGRSDGLSRSTHSTRRQIETEAEIISESTMTPGSTQSFATSTGAVGEPWPSGIELDEMVDDFIVTLTEEDDDFLAMRQSVIPSDGGMPGDLIDLALYRFEQESMADRAGRDRRSVSADTGTTIAPAATNELSSWIRNNWPEREAFTPPPDDPMQMVTKGVYQSKNGTAYMFIGGACWKFVSTTRRAGYLENEKTKKQLLIVRRMPNFLWGFTSMGRKKLRLGPIPEADIPKSASVSPELTSWVARRWGAAGADVKPGGGIRISDGIYENKKRNLFLKVNGAFWKFRFMADRSHAELSNQNGETVSLQFAEGGWNRASVASTEAPTTETNRLDRTHIIENLFNYDFYNGYVKSQLKEIVQAVVSGMKEIRYSELLYKVKEQCDVWFAKEYLVENSTTVAEIMLARDEMEVRIGHLRFSGRNDTSNDTSSLWDYYNLEVVEPVLNEYGQSLLPGSVDDAIFLEASKTTNENNRFATHRNNLTLEINQMRAAAEKLEKRNEELRERTKTLTTELQRLQNSMDRLNRSYGIGGAKAYMWRFWVIADLEKDNIKKNIYNKSEDFRYSMEEFARNKGEVQKIRLNVTGLKNNLTIYNENVNSIETQLADYRMEINKVRKIINSNLNKGVTPSDILSCMRACPVAYRATFFSLAYAQVIVKWLVRNGYTLDDVTTLEKLDVAKWYVSSQSALIQRYLELLANLPIDEIKKINFFGDFRDICSAQREAARFYKKSHGSLSGSETHASLLDSYYELSISDEGVEGVLLLTAATIYGILKHPTAQFDCFTISPGLIIEEFVLDKKAKGPLASKGEKPEGFFSLRDMKDSNQFVTQREFTDQFADYKDKFSKYEASLISVGQLVSSGLSLSQLYSIFKNFYRFDLVIRIENIAKAGGVAFVELYDGNWLVVSCFADAVRSKYVSAKDMAKNKYLSFLIKNPLGPVPGLDGKPRPNPQGGAKDGHINREWQDLKQSFVIPFLGGKSPHAGSVPLILMSERTGNYCKSDGLLFNEMQVFTQECLNEIANGQKNHLYYPSYWQSIADAYVPFYGEIYRWQTDREHVPDVKQLLFDTFTVILTAVPLGLSLAKLSQGTVKAITGLVQEAQKQGLTGARLVKAVVAKLPEVGLKIGAKNIKTGIVAMYDLIEPVPLKTSLTLVYKGIMKSAKPRGLGSLMKPVGLKTDGNVAASVKIPAAPSGRLGTPGKINENWRKNDISLDGMIKGDGSLNKGVYRNAVASTSANPEGFEYYIEAGSGKYQVRWDDYARTWRVVDPKHPRQFSYAVPVKLDESGQWITHNDIPGRGGNALDQFERVGNLLHPAKNQIAPVSDLLARARDESLDLIDNFKKDIRDGKNKREIDNLLDIFIGGHDDALKGKLLSSLGEQHEFLKNLKTNNVVYRSGYSVSEITDFLEIELNSGAARHPVIKAYIDAVVDIGAENFKNKDELVGLMSAVMLRASHGVAGLAELTEPSAKISGNGLDVSGVVKPVLAGMVKSADGEAISCLLAHVSYIKKHPDLHDNFLKKYNAWKDKPEGSLPWVFPTRGSGSRLQLVGTDKGALRHGRVQPLIGRGVLFAKSASSPGIDFNFVRSDAVVDTADLQPQKFTLSEISREDGRLHGFVGISPGDQADSISRNGPAMGSWGATDSLDSNVVVIEVSNGQSGTIGISIPLDQLPEGKPFIISAGDLSGCTMAYAVDGNMFYAYHSGQMSGNSGWLTSREGAASLYRAHLSLTGRTVPGYNVADNKLADESGVTVPGNDALIDILSTYDKSTLNYFGKVMPDGVSTRTTRVEDNVNQFDYNKAFESDGSRVGVAYALLVKDKGKVKVTTYSEDMSVVMREGKAGILTLDNSEYILKNFDENFERRKFEEIRLENEPLIELGADEKEKESFIETVFSQDSEIKNYISNPYENSRNAVQRLWNLFFGSESSGIVKGFDENGLSTEDARKVEGLKNLVRDQDFSIEVRAINYWESDRTSAINKAHFAFVLNFPTVRFILDPTARALIENIGGPLVKAEQQWLRACREALANSTATVKYKDFSSYENALEFSPAYPVDARTYVEGSFLVREAPWYREDGATSTKAASSTASPDRAPGEVMPAPGDDQTARALLRTLLATAPAKIDENGPVRDPACEAGLIHFFSFENGLADVIAPNVSLQPFDSTSTTTGTSVADSFGGKAMQVSSLNRGGDGLNGMKLADDVSSRPQFSIGFWFKSDGVQHHAPVLCNKDWGVGLNPGFVIDQQKNGWLKFNVADGSKRADAFIKFTRNACVYVAMTFDTAASTATAYVGDPIHGAQTATLNLDGMDMSGIAGAHGTIALNEDVLGNYYSRYGHTHGSMTFDDLAMWDHVLTQQELDALAMSGLTGGLIHFFPFENSPADLVAPNVSLQPFDGSSTTHAAFIADHFSGEAMQVFSLNWAPGALNGMKLADDVSSHPQFSIGFWFKSDGVQNHAPVLGNKDWSASVNPGFVIDQQKDGWLKFNVGDGKNGVDKFIPFSRDAWVYVAMTFDTAASTATAYVCETSGACQAATLDLRGMDMGRITGTHSTIGLNEDALGNYHSRRNDGYGTMAFNDLAMWNWVLTETEVRSLGGWGHSLFELLGD